MPDAPVFPPLIITHAIAASYVLLLGPVNLLRRRRDRAHRLIGYGWTAMMLVTCLSSFAIFRGGFSWLHGLSVFTLFSVGAGIVAAARGNVPAHRYNMTGSYVGTVVAFAFAAFMPGRLIPRLALSDPLSLAFAGLLTGVSSVGFVLLVVGRGSGRRGGQGEGTGSLPATGGR